MVVHRGFVGLLAALLYGCYAEFPLPAGADGKVDASVDAGEVGACRWQDAGNSPWLFRNHERSQESRPAIRRAGVDDWNVWLVNDPDSGRRLARHTVFSGQPGDRELVHVLDQDCTVPRRDTWFLCRDTSAGVTVSYSPMESGWGRVRVHDGTMPEILEQGPVARNLSVVTDPANNDIRWLFYRQAPQGMEGREPAEQRPTPIETQMGQLDIGDSMVAHRDRHYCVVGIQNNGELPTIVPYRAAGSLEMFPQFAIEEAPLPDGLGEGCYQPELFDLGEEWLLLCAKCDQGSMLAFSSPNCQTWSRRLVDVEELELPSRQPMHCEDNIPEGPSTTIVAGPEGRGAVMAWARPAPSAPGTMGEIVVLRVDASGNLIGRWKHPVDHQPTVASIGGDGERYLVGWEDGTGNRFSLDFRELNCE